VPLADDGLHIRTIKTCTPDRFNTTLHPIDVLAERVHRNCRGKACAIHDFLHDRGVQVDTKDLVRIVLSPIEKLKWSNHV